jgi:hypothetical protein
VCLTLPSLLTAVQQRSVGSTTFLETTLENSTRAPMVLERVAFLPTPSFTAERVARDVAAPSSGGPLRQAVKARERRGWGGAGGGMCVWRGYGAKCYPSNKQKINVRMHSLSTHLSPPLPVPPLPFLQSSAYVASAPAVPPGGAASQLFKIRRVEAAPHAPASPREAAGGDAESGGEGPRTAQGAGGVEAAAETVGRLEIYWRGPMGEVCVW